MQTVKRYNFMLSAVAGDGGMFSRVARPQYQKLAIKYSRVSGEVYYEKSLDSEFTFVGDDFDFIHSLGIRTKFTMSIYEGGTLIIEGTFKKADGKTDVDNKAFTVSLTLEDEFKKIKNGKDDEHDVIKMMNGKERTINVKLHPLYQFYEYNQSYPTNISHNIVSGVFTDFDIEGEKYAVERTLFDDGCAGSATIGNWLAMHTEPTAIKINITGEKWGDEVVDNGDLSSFYGEYTNIPSVNGNNIVQWMETVIPSPYTSIGLEYSIATIDGKRYSARVISLGKLPNDPYIGLRLINIYMLRPLLTNSELDDVKYIVCLFSRPDLNSEFGCVGQTVYTQTPTWLNDCSISEATIHTSTNAEDLGEIALRSTTTRGNIFKFVGTFEFRSCFCRALFGSVTLPPLVLSEAFLVNEETDRLKPSAQAYRYAHILTVNEYIERAFVSSTRISANPGRFDIKNSSGQYYLPPTDGEEYQPIFTKAWTESRSVWIKASELPVLFPIPTQVEPIEDFYNLGDLIKGLVEKVDSNIVFEADETHSQFLFAANNPVTGLPNNALVVTQKSNLLKLHYDYPAWKGAITFNKLFGMLRNVFNCYYDIYRGSDNKWHMRIEHILFYMNGLSYTPQSRQSLNLTQWYDANGKDIAFHSNKWEYNTSTQASRYEFSWMDTQSEPFAGYPIIIPEEYLVFSDEKTEKRPVELFSADINFMLAVPSEVSSDGFLLAEAVTDGDEYVVPEIDVTNNGITYILQNGNLAYMVLHPKYFPYNVYSRVININNGLMAAVYIVSRLRTNSVEFNRPAGFVPTPHHLYRTSVSDGEVSTLTIDLTSNKVNVDLMYETETD